MSQIQSYFESRSSDIYIQRYISNILIKSGWKESKQAHAIDFLLSERCPKKINKMSLKHLDHHLKKWDKTMAKKMNKNKCINEIDGVDISEIHNFGDGYRIVKLLSKQAYKNEGDSMGHCIGGYYSEDENKCTAYSLRDKWNKPHITFDINSSQIQGRSNQPINMKYAEYALWIIKKYSTLYNSNTIRRLGLIPITSNICLKNHVECIIKGEFTTTESLDEEYGYVLPEDIKDNVISLYDDDLLGQDAKAILVSDNIDLIKNHTKTLEDLDTFIGNIKDSSSYISLSSFKYLVDSIISKADKSDIKHYLKQIEDNNDISKIEYILEQYPELYYFAFYKIYDALLKSKSFEDIMNIRKALNFDNHSNCEFLISASNNINKLTNEDILFIYKTLGDNIKRGERYIANIFLDKLYGLIPKIDFIIFLKKSISTNILDISYLSKNNDLKDILHEVLEHFYTLDFKKLSVYNFTTYTIQYLINMDLQSVKKFIKKCNKYKDGHIKFSPKNIRNILFDMHWSKSNVNETKSYLVYLAVKNTKNMQSDISQSFLYKTFRYITNKYQCKILTDLISRKDNSGLHQNIDCIAMCMDTQDILKLVKVNTLKHDIVGNILVYNNIFKYVLKKGRYTDEELKDIIDKYFNRKKLSLDNIVFIDKMFYRLKKNNTDHSAIFEKAMINIDRDHRRNIDFVRKLGTFIKRYA